MTINELLSEVDELKPNQYGDEQKIRWINKVEKTIIEEIIKMREPDKKPEETEESEESAGNEETEFTGYTEATNMDTELVVKEPYTDLYKYYLFSMIDMHNEEYDRYQNSSQMFNAAYQDFANYWYRTHRGKQPMHWKN